VLTGNDLPSTAYRQSIRGLLTGPSTGICTVQSLVLHRRSDKDFHSIAAPGPQTCACGFAHEMLRVLHRNSPVFPEAIHRLDTVSLTNRAILLE
jgi:hypothetical protein